MGRKSEFIAMVLSLCILASISVCDASRALSKGRLTFGPASSLTVGTASSLPALHGKHMMYPNFASGMCPFGQRMKCEVTVGGMSYPISFTACSKDCGEIPAIGKDDVHLWANGLWSKFLGFKKNFPQIPSDVVNDFNMVVDAAKGMLSTNETDTFELLISWVNSIADHPLKAIVKTSGMLLSRVAWTPYASKPWKNKKVVIVGAGPIGLRMAVEALLLGAHVTIGEARDSWNRANVMKMWPIAKYDLDSLGITEYNLLKGEYPICNIAMMQHAIYRIALVLGADFRIMKFKELRKQSTSYAAIFESSGEELMMDFDAIFDASGVTAAVAASVVNGKPVFDRHVDSSGSKRVAVTANFERFSGDTGKKWAYGETSLTAVGMKYADDKRRFGVQPRVELRDLVWFQSVLSNYIVMALDLTEISEKFHGVINNWNETRSALLKGHNINKEELLNLVQTVAQDWMIPFKEDEKGQPLMLHDSLNKMAIFDFMSGSMSTNYADGRVSMIQPLPCEKQQHVLVVGDALRAPFWPEGTGMSRGVLSVLHAGFALSKVWRASDSSSMDAALEKAKTWAHAAAYAGSEDAKQRFPGPDSLEEYVLHGYSQ